MNKGIICTSTTVSNESTAETTAIWKNHVSVPETPDGFTVRTSYPTNPDGVKVMLERWKA